jgi:hypothetical protein
MRAVVTYSPVARVASSKRVAFGVGVGEPREVLADLRGVGAAGLLRQRRPFERRVVVVEPAGKRLRQDDSGAAAARRRDPGRVLKRLSGSRGAGECDLQR